MGCFLVPGIEATFILLLGKVVGKERVETLKLNWLSTMLWGGFALLAIEHVWHGEVVPWPPFLTAMSNPADTAAMLHEMMIVGTTMSVAITVAWIGLVAAYHLLPRLHARVSGRSA